MGKITRILSVVVASMLFAVGLGAVPAQAVCDPDVAYTSTTCFWGAEGQTSGGNDHINVDGAFSSQTSIYGMDVAVLDLNNRRHYARTDAPNGYKVDGHNTRTMQLVDVDGDSEFIGAGYTAGCGENPYTDPFNDDKGCTGTNVNYGIKKKTFFDGRFCISRTN